MPSLVADNRGKPLRGLTDEQVAAIRADEWSGTRALARQYGVNPGSMSRLRRGLTYRPTT